MARYATSRIDVNLRFGSVLTEKDTLIMHARVFIPLIALFAMLAFFSMQGDAADGPATVNDASAREVGRYQVSVFGPTQNRAGPGYYIIDTATGELWSNYGDNKPSRVSGPLIK